MGLFNLFSSKKEASKSEMTCTLPTNEYDFFKVDVYDIFKYPNIHLRAAEKNSEGDAINTYYLQLPTIELKMFDRLEIILHPTGEKALTFYGNYNKLSKDAIAFINYCAEKYGPDMFSSNGSGRVTSEEVRQILQGLTFSRMWQDININNYNRTFQLTLLSVPNKEGAILPEFIMP